MDVLRMRLEHRQRLEAEMKEIPKEVRDQVLEAMYSLRRAADRFECHEISGVALDLGGAAAIANLDERHENEEEHNDAGH